MSVFLPLKNPIFRYERAGICDLNFVMNDFTDLIETANISCAVEKWLKQLPKSFQQVKHNLTEGERVALRRDLAFLNSAMSDNEDGQKIVVPVLRELSEEDGVIPELTYDLYALNNFRLINPAQPRKMGNFRMIRRFTNNLDEEWFVIIHCVCATLSEELVSELIRCGDSATKNNKSDVIHHLTNIGHFIAKIADDFRRLQDACDPDIYDRQVKPFLGKLNQEENPLFQILSGFFRVQHSSLVKDSFIQKMRQRMTPSQVTAIKIVETCGDVVGNFVNNSRGLGVKRAFNYALDNFFRICCIAYF